MWRGSRGRSTGRGSRRGSLRAPGRPLEASCRRRPRPQTRVEAVDPVRPGRDRRGCRRSRTAGWRCRWSSLTVFQVRPPSSERSSALCLGLDERVDDLGVRRARWRCRCGRGRPSGRPSSSVSRFQVVAAVIGDVQPGARAAGAEEPRPAPVLPHRGEQLVRVRRIDDEVGGAGALVDVEHPLPGLAAVGGLEDAALGVLAPEPAHRGYPGDVRIGGVEDDAVDALGLLETQVLPGVATVERPVDAVADDGAVARVALARAHPDDVGVGLEDRDGRRSKPPADRRRPASR